MTKSVFLKGNVDYASCIITYGLSRTKLTCSYGLQYGTIYMELYVNLRPFQLVIMFLVL